jgi:glutamate/tyrosine decarboxylase-like PLP-dependent enzyme
VGSAPCWSFGRYDPLREIGQLAEEHNLWMHVDACVGGYLAPFYEKLGRPMPPWDFRIPQVKSISADLHKFGYCPKPLSTIVWASEELLQYHYCHPENWPAGPYRMVGFAGSRSAGPVFAAWAIMNYLGEAGYLDLARRLMATEAKLREGVNAIEGLAVFETDLMPFTIRGTTVNLEQLMAVMMEKGWILLGNHEPPLINVPIDAATTDEISDTFLADLADAAERVRSGRVQGSSSLRYG